jgi:hypothetical protein
VPSKSYVLCNGETYFPDFIIKQNNDKFFVEIKGTRYKNRSYKIDLFRKTFKDKKIMMIDDISPFRENQTYQEGLNE